MKYICLILLFILYYNQCYSQHCYGENLVPNPSLDEYNACPRNMGQIDLAVPWTQPLFYSTSDYYNKCILHDTNTFDTAYFAKFPWRTEGMAGIIIWHSNKGREYIEVPLKKQLIAGLCYYVEFYTIPLQFTYRVVDAIGAYFSDTVIKFNYDTIMFGDTIVHMQSIIKDAQINNPVNKIIKDTLSWTKISGTFIAQGNETAMMIGNFITDSNVHYELFINNPVDWESYYFFDDFVVCICDDTIPPPKPPEPPNVIFVPNVFTPNGDGKNDKLYLRGANIKDVSFSIYNRWGELVFKTQGINEGWTGRYKNKDCAEGVYFYIANVTFINGEATIKKGNVTLIR